MKRLLLLLVSIFCTQLAIAQLGTAPDFMVTDINGGEHHLYEILDENKIVVLDVSTTWCGPCWNVHQQHLLEDLNTKYGPDGTDEIRVIFYEADESTTIDDLNGTGSNTQGDWVTGVSYPIVNENPVTLPLNVYAPQGYPTINIIRPTDREIVADMWDYSLEEMNAKVDEVLAEITVSSNQDLLGAEEFKAFPNPVVGELQLTWKDIDGMISVEIFNAVGQTIYASQTNNNRLSIDVSSFEHGSYYVTLSQNNQLISNQRFIK